VQQLHFICKQLF